MPLYPALRQRIIIPLTNLVFGDTIIKQQGIFLELRHAQDAAGVCQATIDVQVVPYAAEGDDYGPMLPARKVNITVDTLYANNDSIVDASTGAILRIRKPLTDMARESESEWLAIAEAYAQSVMFQGDFFEVMRRFSPIDIEEMIITHIQQADAMGRFL
jgi:hypothetical protein